MPGIIHSRILAALVVGFGLLLAGSSLVQRSSAQEQANGKALFEKRCGGCHALDRDKEGPRLGGVYGRAAASVDSYQYSDALKKSKIVWTDEMLDRWLAGTERLVPGNEMSFYVERADERDAIIAYLKRTSRK